MPKKETPNTIPEALEALEEELETLDVTQLFGDLGEGPQPTGRPDDYPGVEIQTILHVRRGFVAGKQFAPDPTGEHRAEKVSDYNIGWEFIPTYVVIDSLGAVFKLLRALETNNGAFLVRGGVAEEAGSRRRRRDTGKYVDVVRRRMADRHEDGALEDVDRQLQMLDLDGVALPEGMSVVEEPQACVEWAVDNLLPTEFRDASFVYQMSCSAGMTKPDDKLSVHIWFFTDRPYSNEELRHWGGWWNAKQQNKIIDTSVFNPVQPHYTNDPGLLDDLLDPLAGRRLGLVRRLRRTVRLYMPSEADLIAEGRLKVRRARQAHRGPQARPKTDQVRIDDAPDTAADDGDALRDSESQDYVGALQVVRLGLGWRGYLEGIGFEGHIRAPILAAIGRYFYENGSRADRRVLKDAIVKAIADTPYLDCGEGSRSREDALEYLSTPPGGTSNVDDMIADIAERQRLGERRASEVCEPTWPPPIASACEAFDQLDKAVRDAVTEALRLRRERLAAFGDNVLPSVFFHTPAQTAVLCEPGVGKTAAMIKSVVEFLRGDPAARAAIAVPTHHLGQGLADRINREFGSEIAAEWYGTNHSDPSRPLMTMCRLAEAAKELQSAGGKLQLLCSSQRHGYCPHHPKLAGEDACGYQRQHQLALSGNVRVWIVPAVTLALAPPPELRRQGPPFPADFDLLVIDEAPWFSMVAGTDEERLGAPVNWLSPEWWAAQTHHAAEPDRLAAIDTLKKIHDLLTRRNCGPVPADVFWSDGISAAAVKQAGRFVWRCKADLRAAVRPGTNRSDLLRALSGVAPLNERVIKVAQVLQVIRKHLEGGLAPSGVELIEHPKNGGRFLRFRWRKDIHQAWVRAPVLYLDASGTGGEEIAKAWLPNIVVAAEARANAPHMRVTQLVDTSVSYHKIFADGSAAEMADGTQEKLARIIETRGPSGLVVCPKKLRERWESANRLPGWELWNFGAIRGRDEARNVRQLAVISRQSPPPAATELLAETIFGREVQKLAANQRYPKCAVGRLMTDGTGRRALADRHPDPLVETVRFAICEGELLQSIGRGRGVRRTADTPLDVLVLTDVPLPLPVDIVVTWKDLCDGAGPIEVLAARGVVPLDHSGMAATLPDWFRNGAAAAKEWFRDRLQAKARLALARDRAKRGECIGVVELVGNSSKELSIGNSHQLTPYRYRRAGQHQANMVLIDRAMHRDARAAVEAVLGVLDKFEPVAPISQGNGDTTSVNNVDVEPARPAIHDDGFFERVRRFFEQLKDDQAAAVLNEPAMHRAARPAVEPAKIATPANSFFERVRRFFEDLREGPPGG